MNRARAIVLIGMLGITTSSAHADELRNGVFNVQLDASGIKSLRRTNDTYDTEYIAANGTLGRLSDSLSDDPEWRLARAPRAIAD